MSYMRQATSQEAWEVFRNSTSTSTSLSCGGGVVESSGVKSGQRLRVSIKFRMGATYNKVLLLVTDLDSVYGIGGEGTAGSLFILKAANRKKNPSRLHFCDFTSLITRRSIFAAPKRAEGTIPYPDAAAHEGLEEGRLARPTRSDHLAEKHRPLGLALLQVHPFLPRYCAHETCRNTAGKHHTQTGSGLLACD